MCTSTYWARRLNGTREFRYNYKNQLRHVWRKSDGDTDTTGMLAKYREDAFGRRVYAESYWELSRRVYLDTRFELDVDVDYDGDTTPMTYVDGGLTSDQVEPVGQTDQKAQWDTFIHRDSTATNEAWYFDFLVDVPTVSGSNIYLGYVAYDIYNLEIYNDHYELWDTANVSQLGTYTTTTSGQHNIGIRAGVSAGIWIDGSQITALTTNGTPSLISSTPVTAGFGTHDVDPTDGTADGITLLENLNYIRSWNRARSSDQIPASGEPQVSVVSFDGPRPVQVDTPYMSGGSAASLIYTNDTENSSRMDFVEAGTASTKLFLPNGRRTTGEVIESGADMVTYGEGGREVTDPGEVMPGVSQSFHVDAVGGMVCIDRITLTDPIEWPWNGPTTSSDFTGWYDLCCVPTNWGKGKPTEDHTTIVTGSPATDNTVSFATSPLGDLDLGSLQGGYGE